MISLKSYLPFLADYLDLTPDAIYERQRVLVRSRMLKAVPGRGPGSGIRAMPATVTQLVLATLATDSLAETESKTKALGKAVAEQGACPLTGARNFAGALEMILSSRVLADKVLSIVVRRPDLTVALNYKEPAHHAQVSAFGKGASSRKFYQRTVEACLPAEAVEEICEHLRQMGGDSSKKRLFEEFEASRRVQSHR